MPGLGRIVGNAAWLLAGRGASQLLAIPFTVVLAERLGPAGFGGFALLVAVGYLANVVTTFGTDMALVREVAAGRPARWAAALAVQLGLSGLAIGILWAAAPLVGGIAPGVGDALRLYAVWLLPAALVSVGNAGLRGAGHLRALGVLTASGAVLQLAAVWALLPRSADLALVAVLLVAAQAVLAVLTWAVTASRLPAFRRRPAIQAADLVEMTASSARLGLLGLLGVLYQRAGVLALALAAGPLATGWFAAAFRVSEASKSGHVALFGALYPELAASQGPASVSRSAWGLSLAGAIAITLGLIVLGPPLVDRLYGPAFRPAAAGLAILALSILPSVVATHRSLELLAAHREREMVTVLAAALGVLGLLLAALVPPLGWTGAAWSIGGAEAFQAVALLALGRRLRSRLRHGLSPVPGPLGDPAR
jgi:O-antigen/teichoic acid export membrane protein